MTMIDIYFEQNYGKLYEKLENGVCELFKYQSNLGDIHHLFLKREIPIKIDKTIWYDLVTPYGYGGPIIMNCQKNNKSLLIEEFKEIFHEYCKDNNIVSEFIRFHPVIGNAIDFKSIYDINHIRNTVGTNLIDFDDPFKVEFSKSCRKNIRKALNNGISFKITEKPGDISKFKRLYYSTMDRNNASDYYYFDDDYFSQCVELFRENLLLVEAIYEEESIAMGLYFVYDKMIHTHLSGTLSEFLYLSPAYILRYAVTKWGKEKGYKLIHHGGGRSNSLQDSLYLFKKQFGKNTEFEFYVGKKVWNREIYNKLCEYEKVNKGSEFFPLYRDRV